MTTKRASHRFITERWVVTGKLVLETPAHFGNGDADPLTDMPLLVDETSGAPLLHGTSIAGALRNYLRERDMGYGKKEKSGSLVSRLFGRIRGDDEGDQSPLIVFDAPGISAGLELRDGVAISPETRTAEDKKKFDMELLAAGSSFDLRFELAANKDNTKELCGALATALQGLQDGQITLGARKRRGFGQVRVEGWQVWRYDLQKKEGLLAWLASEREWDKDWPELPGKSLAEKLQATINQTDKREIARLEAFFSIDGTLLIRSGFGESDSGPDLVHLHSARDGGKPTPVIPGTSWAGVLRHQALKIARTVSDNKQAMDKDMKPLWKDDKKEKPLLISDVFVEGLFGPSEIKPGEKNVRASRVEVRETVVENTSSLVMTRVKIDRFTGGAFESALFTEQPVIGKPGVKNVRMDLTLRNPREAELGLLMLLLKDLWTGELPIGGEAGVGRGRLQGFSASLSCLEGDWQLLADGDQVRVTPDASELERFVQAFNRVDEWQVSHD